MECRNRGLRSVFFAILLERLLLPIPWPQPDSLALCGFFFSGLAVPVKLLRLAGVRAPLLARLSAQVRAQVRARVPVAGELLFS